MWISRKRYEELLTTAARNEERADWLRTRVNQLEFERADLLAQRTGRPQRAITVERKPDQFSEFPDGTVNFDDMGDEAARSAGIEWDDNGRVKG